MVLRNILSSIFTDEWDSIYSEIKRKDLELQIDSSSIIHPTILENNITTWKLFGQRINDLSSKLNNSISWTSRNQEKVEKLNVLWSTTRRNAIDNNADFLVVDNNEAFKIFDTNQKEISCIVGRDIDLPIVTATQFTNMLSGERDKTKLGFDKHKTKITFL